MGGIIHTCYNIYVSENRGGNVAHLVELRTSTVLTQVQFLSVAKDCFPRAAFQCRLSFSVYTSPCAVACINIFTHIRASLVNVRVQSIMETIKKNTQHAPKGRTALPQLAFPMETNPNFPVGEIPMGQHSCEKERKFVTNKQTKLKSEQLGCFEIVLLLKNILKIS